MMSSYLDMLDALLGPGIAQLSRRFVATQERFVAGRQQADGGFAGRQGGSDVYYTDFSLRVLSWLAPDHGAFKRAATYLSGLAWPPRDTVECFNALNCCRLLERQCPSLAERLAWAQQRVQLSQWLYAQLLPGGDSGRSPNDDHLSAYHTFLGSLCFQLLAVDMPMREATIHAIAALRCPDGGYAERTGPAASQTNATAAAIAFLMMNDALSREEMAATARFLARMQSADGGLKPHADVEGGDMLSTFTGLVTLWGLGGFSQIDAAAVARFLRRMACADGGFLACDGDDTPDAEYTYYGIGTLALLRLLTPAGASLENVYIEET